jgi:hypothetical protein
MSDGEGAGFHQDDGRTGLSRRHFLYGTTAAAAGAAVFGRTARGRALAGTPGRLVHGRHAGHVVPAQSQGAFTWIQTGALVDSGTGSLSLTLTKGSTAGNLLVAVIVSTDPAKQSTAPSNWQLATAMPAGSSSPAGRVEIWYYLGTPASPGCPQGIRSQTFGTSSTADSQGFMAEFALPPGTSMLVFDAPGRNAGSGTSFGVTAASGNVVGDLGIAVAGVFFGGDTSGSWTGPTPAAKWTSLQSVTGAADDFGAWYNLSLGGTAPRALTAGYGTASGDWAFAFAAFRAVTFQPIYLTGGEMVTMAALDPASQQQLIMGGDVEGLFRSSDFGNTWQPAQNGLYAPDWRDNACVAWSELEASTVYACVGANAAAKNPSGGLLVSSDGGITWSPRSTGVQFQGNGTGSPPRPSTEAQDADRSTGRLLAQDPSDPDKPYLYAATYSGGIARSYGTTGSSPVPPGTNWTPAGLTEAGFYPRALVINPADNQELWAGCWDSDGTGAFGGIWHCTDAQTATTTAKDWTQLTTAPTSTVSDLLVLDGYVYAAYTLDGMYAQQIGATGDWTSLNVGAVNLGNGQIWTSIDGYVASTSPLVHVIIAGSSSGTKKAASGNPYFTNIVKITINYKTNKVTAIDLTGTANLINTATMPPNDQGWWLNNPTGSYRNWLGGNKFVNPHILIDPNDPADTIFVTGASGFFYTTNASAAPDGINWQLAGTGVPLSAVAAIGVDPGNAMHVVLASADHPQTDMTDATGWNAGDVNPVPMPSLFPSDQNYQGTESHAIAFDPGSNLYMGTNEKYGQNGYGTVWYRLADDSSFTWYDTQYNETVASQLKIATSAVKAPIGVFAGVNGNNTFLVVVSDGVDIWRATAPASAVKTGTTAWTWKQLSTGIGTGGSISMNCPIVADSQNPAVLYVFDRAQGVYRSTSYGLAGSWTQIWASSTTYPLNVNDGRSGWLAVNPNVGGELWVTTSDGVVKLTSADTGTVVGNGIGYNDMNGTTSQFPYGAAGIAITSSEKVYTLAISGNTTGQPALPDVQLLTTTTTSGPPWSPADAAGGSIASYVSWPTSVALAQSPYPAPAGQQILLIASDSDWAVWGVPTQ